MSSRRLWYFELIQPGKLPERVLPSRCTTL